MGIRHKHPSQWSTWELLLLDIKWREVKGHWGVTKIGYTILYPSGFYQGLTLSPQETFGNICRYFWFSQTKEAKKLAYSELRPGMLLNIL